MKIVVLSENNYGCGASIASYRLAKGLSKDDNVFFVYEKNKSKYDIFKDVNFDTWHLGESNNKIKSFIFKGFNYLARLTRTNIDRWFLFQLFKNRMKKFNPDIIHFHNTYFMHKQIAELSEEFPCVWTMHDEFALYLYNYKIKTFEGSDKIYCPISEWRKKFYNPELLLNNQKSNIIFTPPSQWLVNLGKEIVKERKPIEVVHNGIDINEFFPVNKTESRTNLGIDLNKFTLLFLAGTGAWERKNSIVIFEALKLIPTLDIQVVAIGSVTNFKFDDERVIKKGAVYTAKALRDVYSSADVFCIPSVLDNLPNTVLESLLCGTPVLGAKAGGIPEMINENETGWLFDPYSADDLANKIKFLYDNFAEIKNKNEICRESVIHKFSEQTMVENYKKIYNNIKKG